MLKKFDINQAEIKWKLTSLTNNSYWIKYFENINSTEIKSTLQISWSEYQTHIRALEVKLCVKVKDEFEDGSLKQFVYLDPQGRMDFQNLIQMLEEFVKPDLEVVGDIVIEENFKNKEDSLYPKDKE